MAYCPECGSEVAKIDVFCPYCGISITPPAAVGGEQEEFANTIVMNQSEMTSPAEFSAPELKEKGNSAAVAVKAETDKTETVENPESAISEGSVNESDSQQNIDKETGDYKFVPTAENYELKTDSVEIPADIFGNQSGAEENNIQQKTESAEETSPSNISENKNIEIIEPIGEASGDVEESEMEVFSATDSRKNEVKAIEKPDLPVVNFFEPDSPSPDDTETVLKPEKNISSEELSQDSAPAVQAPPQASDEQKDFSISAPINRPDEELPLIPSSQSVFDSVQIVQKEAESAPIKEEAAPPVKSMTDQAVPAPAVEERLPRESRPYTSPNMNTGSDTDGRSKAKLKPLDEGTVLNGRYEIVRKIGGGGMGAVYLASDKNLGGVLRAVKEMVQSYIEETQQEKAVSDFKRESMLLTSLDHQAIPTIYDYFYDEKEARFYLVMKYISGGDLASRLRSTTEGKIDEKTVTEWAIQIADVLDYLHNRQPPIVYRDLKPANIMIDGNTGRVMLIDFGIARWINKEEKGVTAVGTMGYAPPELFSGNVEPRSDIYSLGSTMFHLLTGADPQSNPLLIFDFQKNPHPRQINPQLSDQMERILIRSVEYNAQKRFDSAAEMRQALEEHLQNLKAGKVSYGIKQTPVSVGLSEEPVFCGFCGQRIIATDMFCAFCGAKQPMAQQGVHQPAPIGGLSPHHATAKLMILGTNELESPTFSLEKDNNLVGRRDPMSNIFPEVDLSKFDPQTKISRRHARIWRDGNQYMIEDLGSSNGTVLQPVLNETIRLMPHQPHVLTSGDKLKLGDTTMHFIVG
jgi:eukaryotic-like serine/threonine-protein kinase